MQPHRTALISCSVALRQTTFLEGPAISGPADFQRPRVSDGGAWRRLVELVVRAALARRRRCAAAHKCPCAFTVRRSRPRLHSYQTILASNDAVFEERVVAARDACFEVPPTQMPHARLHRRYRVTDTARRQFSPDVVACRVPFIPLLCPIHTVRQTRRDRPVCVVSGGVN